MTSKSARLLISLFFSSLLLPIGATAEDAPIRIKAGGRVFRNTPARAAPLR